MSNVIKLTREEERKIDRRLGPDFKKQMNKFAETIPQKGKFESDYIDENPFE